jgi:hypothetical protein
MRLRVRRRGKAAPMGEASSLQATVTRKVGASTAAPGAGARAPSHRDTVTAKQGGAADPAGRPSRSKDSTHRASPGAVYFRAGDPRPGSLASARTVSRTLLARAAAAMRVRVSPPPRTVATCSAPRPIIPTARRKATIRNSTMENPAGPDDRG